MKTLTFYLILAVPVLFGGCGRSSEEAVAENPATWSIDFAAASQRAQETGKYMLLDFTGSDWCGWCIKLKEEVFSREPFVNYAKENLVLVQLDFPIDKEQTQEMIDQNEELSKRFDVQGFPTIVVLSPTGELVGKTGYRSGGSKAYVTHLEEILASHQPQ